jgi:hypothetical protein
MESLPSHSCGECGKGRLRELGGPIVLLDPNPTQKSWGWCQVGGDGETGFSATAKAAEGLAEVDEELRTCLRTNSELLEKLEREVLYAESLAVHILQTQQAC